MYFLQMPEEQAFCVLVKLMYDYGLRDLYKDRFDNLHMRFYQLNRLIEVNYKSVIYIHNDNISDSAFNASL